MTFVFVLRKLHLSGAARVNFALAYQPQVRNCACQRTPMRRLRTRAFSILDPSNVLSVIM